LAEQTKEIALRAPDDIRIVDGQFCPESFKQAWYIAEVYAKSGMVPKAYTNNPAGILVATQLGAQLGMDTLTSLQNIASVNGMPTVWGDAQKALVMNSGSCEFFVEYFEGTFPKDDFRAICVAKRNGTGFKYDPDLSLDDLRKRGLFVNEYSVADAKKAGLWTKAGVWQTNPKRMLKMRARAFTLRDGWPDALKGLYSAEEMEGVDDDVVDVKAETLANKEEVDFTIEGPSTAAGALPDPSQKKTAVEKPRVRPQTETASPKTQKRQPTAGQGNGKQAPKGNQPKTAGKPTPQEPAPEGPPEDDDWMENLNQEITDEDVPEF